jgi:rhamnosyl/mannosyltransferase
MRNANIDSLKILHVYRTYFPDPPGGLQEAIRQICLATRGKVENTVFTLSPHPEPAVLQRPEARIVRCRSWGAPASCDLGGIKALRTFRELAHAADVVQYHFPWPFADILHLATRHATPSILTYHSDIVRQRLFGVAYRPLMMRMLGAMAAIVPTSQTYMRTSPVFTQPCIRDKARVIPLGIDDSSYPATGDGTVLARLGLQAGEPYFLFIGALRYYKGAHFLVAAARGLGAKVVFAGSSTDLLRKSAAEQGIDNAICAGQINDAEKVALLKGCRALVLPSHLRSEAFGMVLVEASMFGKPMICCEIGTGTSFVNVHGETGFVVPPASPDALAGAMRSLLEDEAMAARMGQTARARYERLFSGPELGRAYTALYGELARCSGIT